MLWKFLLILALFSSGASVYGDELPEACEAAVDAADRLNLDHDKKCDYSNTGLNGVLHKAFVSKEGSDRARSAAVASVAGKNILPQAIAGEFDSAQQLNTLRYELLQQVARECAAGFTLENERYLPANGKSLRIELDYRCL